MNAIHTLPSLTSQPVYHYGKGDATPREKESSILFYANNFLVVYM